MSLTFVTVPLSTSNTYKDQVVCDVLDMDVCHILLGHPWQYDYQTTHKGQDNTYEFYWMGKRIVLVPIGSIETPKFTSTSKK